LKVAYEKVQAPAPIVEALVSSEEAIKQWSENPKTVLALQYSDVSRSSRPVKYIALVIQLRAMAGTEYAIFYGNRMEMGLLTRFATADDAIADFLKHKEDVQILLFDNKEELETAAKKFGWFFYYN
jgi:hypothetical protein